MGDVDREESDAVDERRDRSRLEVDDPEHCRFCGAEIGPAGALTDEHGRPMVFHAGKFYHLEECADCLVAKRLKELCYLTFALYENPPSRLREQAAEIRSRPY